MLVPAHFAYMQCNISNNRHISSYFFHRLMACLDRQLDLEYILTCLYQRRVDSAKNEPFSLHHERLLYIISDVSPSAGSFELGKYPLGPIGPIIYRGLFSLNSLHTSFASSAGSFVKLNCLVAVSILGKLKLIGAKCVSLNAIGPCLEVASMNLLYPLWSGRNRDTMVESIFAIWKILCFGIETLYLGPHGTIEKQYPLFCCVNE